MANTNELGTADVILGTRAVGRWPNSAEIQTDDQTWPCDWKTVTAALRRRARGEHA